MTKQKTLFHFETCNKMWTLDGNFAENNSFVQHSLVVTLTSECYYVVLLSCRIHCIALLVDELERHIIFIHFVAFMPLNFLLLLRKIVQKMNSLLSFLLCLLFFDAISFALFHPCTAQLLSNFFFMSITKFSLNDLLFTV